MSAHCLTLLTLLSLFPLLSLILLFLLSPFPSSPSPSPLLSSLQGKRKACSHPLFSVHWSRVALDEAHIIRNPSTSVSQGAASLSAGGCGRWLGECGGCGGWMSVGVAGWPGGRVTGCGQVGVTMTCGGMSLHAACPPPPVNLCRPPLVHHWYSHSEQTARPLRSC